MTKLYAQSVQPTEEARSVIRVSGVCYRILWMFSISDSGMYSSLKSSTPRNTRRTYIVSISSWSRERISRDHHKAIWTEYVGILLPILHPRFVELTLWERSGILNHPEKIVDSGRSGIHRAHTFSLRRSWTTLSLRRSWIPKDPRSSEHSNCI